MRKQLTNALASFLKNRRFLKTNRPTTTAVLQACLHFLGKSDAEIVLVNLEDLWFETQPQNVPGTTDERVNWRRKARLTVEEIRRNAGVLQLLSALKMRG